MPGRGLNPVNKGGIMKRKKELSIVTLHIILAVTLIISCGEKKEDKTQTKAAPALTIVSGSENEGLEPLVKQFAAKEGVNIQITYQGSVDMTLALTEQGANIPFDAIWPANSLWITLGDQHKVVKYAESIMRSPVILGVKKSVAERLGWIGKDLTTADILEATESGKLRFAMTSATQSNSGSSAYIGFLYAMSGVKDVLQEEHINNPEIQEKVKKLLAGVDRSSGSSGWLKDTVVSHYERFQAMFNYEAMIIEANQELVRLGKEPLYAIYPLDGVMISDSPLAYINKGDPAKDALFKKLQAYLLSKEVQDIILKQGRRTGLVGMNPDQVNKAVFNPEWGIDVARIISPVPTPAEPVIRKALDLYQVALRKPSCTAYVVDVSGSMEGRGINDLKAALTILLDPDQSRRYMLQPSPRDIHMIIPFNNQPLEGIRAVGNSHEVMGQLLAFVNSLTAGGGTNIYAAAARAIELMGETTNLEDYFPSVILMTDGRSQGDIQVLQAAISRLPAAADIPIFSITFGDADESQLRQISEITIARVFPGSDLVKAFRSAKGYN